MTGKLVARRCVLFLGGYEPAPAERQHARFVRELVRFEKTWGVRAAASAPDLAPDGATAVWRIETEAPNWRVETDYVLLRWDDFVMADFARGDWQRLPKGILALGDFIFSGTLFRYFATNWRYALFFLYPVLIIAVLAGIGVALALALATLPVAGGGFKAAVIGAVVSVGLLLFGGRGLQLPYLLDDWIFAREFVRRTRHGLDARIDRFADEVASRLNDDRYDEVVLAGHSLGAPFSIEVLDRALRRDPGLGRGKTINLVSTGSSLLKVALHPAAAWLRGAVGRVSARDGVFWVEYQAIADVINFYKTDPVRALRLPPTGKPSVVIVRLREMLSPEAYRRFRLDFFRLHRQFVMGNERRYVFDYFMHCCGPISFASWTRNPEAAVAGFGADGGLQGSPAGATPR